MTLDHSDLTVVRIVKIVKIVKIIRIVTILLPQAFGRKRCNPDERRCSRQRRRVCFTHDEKYEKKTQASLQQGGRIDLTGTRLIFKPVQTQISRFRPRYTVDLTSPSVANFMIRLATPFVIDLTIWESNLNIWRAFFYICKCYLFHSNVLSCSHDFGLSV